MKLLLLSVFLTLPWAQAQVANCQLRSHEELGQLVLEQVKGLKCPAGKKVHLTFDDGPHPAHTPKLLTELNRRGVKATFFVSTTNITPNKTQQRNIVRDMSEGGHLLANHGYEHRAYDLRFDAKGNQVEVPMTDEEQKRQIATSVKYLDEASGGKFSRQRLKLFRFPYGRGALPSDLELEEMQRRGLIRFSSTNRTERLKEYHQLSGALHAVASTGHGHLLWNHDSMDSTSSAPKSDNQSKAQYVKQNLERLCSSRNMDIVALFHDIKAFTPETIASIVDVGQCLGLKFVKAEEVLNSEKLIAAGTYIPKENILGAPVQKLNEVEDIIKRIACTEDPLKEDPNACYSESLDRYFADCEGGAVSICIKGKWYKRTEEKEAECRTRGL